MLITDIAIHRPVMTVMAIGGLMLLGYISIDRIGVDLFPNVEFPFVSIETTLEGASPEVMESEVTDPLEEEVNATAGIKTLHSSSSDGYARVMIEFELDEDPDVKTQDVRNRVDRAIRKLPPETDQPVVRKMDPDADPVLTVIVSGPRSIAELTHYADKTIKERLQRVAGVGGIDLVGGREREIRIWVDAYKLRAYRITVHDVINAIRREHAEIPGGRLEASGGRAEFTLKTRGEVTELREFGDIVINRRGGGTIKVRDVARVENGLEDERTYAELDGVPGVALDIRRQSGENTVAVVSDIRAALDELRREAPPGIKIVSAKDVSRFIESSIADVKIDLLIGIFLVITVTLTFLLNTRATLIVATVIPVAVVSTFFAFYVLDFSINMLTMMALSVSVGLLVDDAIVVLESIYTRVEQGDDPVEASSRGTARVGTAVIAGSLSIMAVFVPIAFMEGIVGRFFFQYGLTIVFAVGISLLVSLTLTPMLCSQLLEKSKPQRGLFLFIENIYQWVERVYQSLLAFSLRHRWLIIVGAFVAVIAGVQLASRVPIAFSPKTDRSEFTAMIEMPLGTGITESREVGRRVAAALTDVRHIEHVFMSIGGGPVSRPNEIGFYIATTHKSERDRNFEFIMQDVRDLIQREAPEAKASQLAEVPWVGAGGGSFLNDITVVIQGSDLRVLEQISHDLLARMRDNPAFVDIGTSYDVAKPEVHVDIDRQRASDLGISIRSLAATIRATIGGTDVTTYEEAGSRYDVRIRLEEENRDSLAKLNLIQVASDTGQLVDLSNIASFSVRTGPVQIDRRNRAKLITLFANSPPNTAVGISMQEMEGIFDELDLPPGYFVGFEGISESAQESVEAITFAFILALVALYMILASQFNSFGQPGVIMTTAPLSFVGAFAALVLFNAELSLFAQIGLVALMGLVMKNGILLVDYANQARNEGLNPHDAMIKAGQLRLRPVLMTAFSTIFGTIPVAFSTSDGAEFRNPLGMIVIGGMLSSTLLTLLVVPVVYTLYEDTMTRIRLMTAGTKPRVSPST